MVFLGLAKFIRRRANLLFYLFWIWVYLFVFLIFSWNSCIFIRISTKVRQTVDNIAVMHVCCWEPSFSAVISENQLIFASIMSNYKMLQFRLSLSGLMHMHHINVTYANKEKPNQTKWSKTKNKSLEIWWSARKCITLNTPKNGLSLISFLFQLAHNKTKFTNEIRIILNAALNVFFMCCCVFLSM